MDKPSKVHFIAAKCVLSYLKLIRRLRISYVKKEDNKFVGYTDVNEQAPLMIIKA